MIVKLKDFLKIFQKVACALSKKYKNVNTNISDRDVNWLIGMNFPKDKFI